MSGDRFLYQIFHSHCTEELATSLVAELYNIFTNKDHAKQNATTLKPKVFEPQKIKKNVKTLKPVNFTQFDVKIRP